MMRSLISVIVLTWCFGSVSRSQGIRPVPEKDEIGTAMISQALKVIDAYHEGAKNNGAKIRLVYFHPSNRDPLPGWRERLNRVVSDIDQFYREGFQRFDIDARLPFDRNDASRYKFHLVEGKHPAEHYSYQSGAEIALELRFVLRGVVDFDREHVFVLHGLCREEDDRFVFDAPYYGRGNAKKGICHAADCRLLDPMFLTETRRKIVFKEHYYERKEQTLALFNTWYIGGAAHELGHGIALPHNNGTADEKRWSGVSLMGRGNHHYRSDQWGGKTPSFLSRSCALRLVSSPLITLSDRSRFSEHDGQFTQIKLTSPENSALGIEVSGEISTKIPAYAVIAYYWSEKEKTDHGATTIPGLVKNGKFRLASQKRFVPGIYRMRLSALHVSGAETRRSLEFLVDSDGKPSQERLQAIRQITAVEDALINREKERARALLKKVPIVDGPEAVKAAVLKGIVDPPNPKTLSSVTEDRVYLSEAAWESAEVGWGKPCRNHYDFRPQGSRNFYLQLNGTIYQHGLYAHSGSNYVFKLDGKWKHFTAGIGLRDGAASMGSARFSVFGDGKELFESKAMRSGSKSQVTLEVEGVKRLELRTAGTEGHVHHSWAIWVVPQLSR